MFLSGYYFSISKGMKLLIVVTTLFLVSVVLFAQDWTEMQKILASDGQADDEFGCSVAISGDYAVIGEHWDDSAGYNAGSAYIFHRSDTHWIQQTKITASDSQSHLQFGISVALSGDYAIIGTFYNDDYPIPGSAYIFHRDGENWTEQAKITASDGFDGNWFGKIVSISENYAIVNGANKSAYIFNRDGSTWTEQMKIEPSDPDGDGFGSSLSIKENFAAVGAAMDSEDGYDYEGAVYIFNRLGATWAEQAKLTASDGIAYYQFGQSIALSESEDCLVVGAFDNYEYGGSGAYIFYRSGTVWTEDTKLLPDDDGFSFGSEVSIYGDYVITGAPFDEDVNSGSAYIFHRNEGYWTQQSKILPSDGQSYDYFGSSVSIYGEYALVGSFSDDNENGTNAGSSYIFNLITPPPNPGNIQIIIDGSLLTISWDEVIGATSYNVYSSENPYEDYENWYLEEEGFIGTSWSTAIENVERFYYVTSVD